MEKHVYDGMVNFVSGLYMNKWKAADIKDVLLKRGLTQEMADQIEKAGYREYRRIKKTANAHIASGSFLFIVGVLISWGIYEFTGGGTILVLVGIIALGIGEFILGLRMRSAMKSSDN